MITDRDDDVHATPPATLEAAEPVFYLAKVRRTKIYLGAARMATRHIRKAWGVQLRVIRCEPPVPRADGLWGHAKVARSMFLIELDQDAPDAIAEWLKILEVKNSQLEKVARAVADERLNSIVARQVAKGAPPLDERDYFWEMQHWDPSTASPSLNPLPQLRGGYFYEIGGDFYPNDIRPAVRYTTKSRQVGVQNEIDWDAGKVVRGGTVILSLDEEDDVSVSRIAELICDGPFTLTKVVASTPAPEPPELEVGDACGTPPAAQPAKVVTAISNQGEVSGEDKGVKLGQQQQKEIQGQGEAVSNLLLEPSGQDEPASKPSSEFVEKKPKATQSKESLPRVSATSVSGSFLGHVPDFVLADWDQARPTPRTHKAQQSRRGRRQASGGAGWFMHRLVIAQQRSTIIVPEVLLAQVIWGGDKKHWPSNWRGRLVHRFGKVQLACPVECPLHDSSVRHGHIHFEFNPQTFLGALESFGYDDANGCRRYDFSTEGVPGTPRFKIDQEQIERDKKAGRLASVYLPLLVFGPAKRMNLPLQQRQLLLAITRELTRANTSSRADRAKIIVGGKKAHSVYPGLPAGVSHVAFNGNAPHQRRRLRGYGYRLIGSTGKGWLHKAGYNVPEEPRDRWLAVGKFLKDLDTLAARFGLVVAAWHQEKAEWKPLADLRAMVNHLEGRRWLKKCVLRIYTPADYLVRWRRLFAERMGFTHIPGGEGAEPVAVAHSSTTPAIRSALDLDKWMIEKGMTNQELAEKLGISERWVRYQRHGTRPWSKKLEKDMEAMVHQVKDGNK